MSGVYPSLAYYNDEGECGTGAVCPWAGSLWVITYGPHCPVGSSDRLYQITPDLRLVVRPESVGGTHADRMIHRESQQLFIGTYLVDRNGNVRTVPIHTMPGRLTGCARHLTDPKNKIYMTDMEEALYELDVNTLETRTLIRDSHNAGHFNRLFRKLGVEPPKGWKEAEISDLFGYHGKGTCSGFGKVFYANNGWHCDEAMKNPAIPAGALAWWDLEWLDNWQLIRPNQFTDITTRDGVYGNEHPDTNPIWAMGWDAKSVILSVTTDGTLKAGGTDLSSLAGEWIRLRARDAYRNATVAFCYRAEDARDGNTASWTAFKFGAGAKSLLHVNEIDPKALSLSVGKQVRVTADGRLELVDCPEAAAAVAKDAPLKTGVLAYEPSSILYVDDRGNRWRLPYGSRKAQAERGARGEGRVCREVCTERDHFNAGGVYYELPAENAHGFAGLRPVATHNRPIFDYGSWRGLFALSLTGEVRLMAIDDMWKAGKARGFGGPWKDTAVKAGEPSDAYLMNGFDRKTLTLKVDRTTTVTMEVDVTGWGVWVKAGEYDAIAAGVEYTFVLPQAMSGYWVRFTSSADCTATAQLDYN